MKAKWPDELGRIRYPESRTIGECLVCRPELWRALPEELRVQFENATKPNEQRKALDKIMMLVKKADSL